MSPLDRIAQLNARVAELETANALLRSQLADGQEQAKRDSATIASLSRINKSALECIRNCIEEHGQTVGQAWDDCPVSFWEVKARSLV